jgi:glycosyltransferase involved in cell wall biosynthesis
MTSPLVSVVIPCYNASDFLTEAIRSVREQTTKCEIIVVDDCSKDHSLELARILLRDYSPSLIITSPQNQGPAAARNAGLRVAQGKYICFLDADDQYTPEFASTAVQVLEDNPTVVAAYCEVEFVNLHRSIEPWQREMTEVSLPSNIVVRTEVARQIGGFSTHPAFRGKVAGEDCAFRRQLPLFGEVAKLHAPLFKYLVRPGDHFDFFLDRLTLRDGRIQATSWSKEQRDGSWAEANRLYEESVLQRAVGRAVGSLETAVDVWMKYHALSRQFDPVGGSLHPFEGFILYWLARGWPGDGRSAAIGRLNGRPTCWLAAGCKEGKKDTVAAVGPSSESGSTLSALQAHLKKLELTDWVTLHAGSSAEVSGGWKEPIRLLFLEGDPSYEAAAQQFQLWSRLVRRHGLAVFQGIDASPGVTKLHGEVAAQRQQWRVVGRFNTLGVLERLV